MKKRLLKSIVLKKLNAPKTMSFKLKAEERKAIQENANRYCGGKISAWVRYASINHKPPKKDLAK